MMNSPADTFSRSENTRSEAPPSPSIALLLLLVFLGGYSHRHINTMVIACLLCVLSLLLVPTTQEVELRSSGSDVRWLSCYETTWSHCSAVFDAFIRHRDLYRCCGTCAAPNLKTSTPFKLFNTMFNLAAEEHHWVARYKETNHRNIPV